MMNSLPSHDYLISGLRLRSEIELPELITAENEPVTPDVEIKVGTVPEHLPGATRADRWAEIANDQVLLRIQDIARYLIRAGREVLLEPAAGASERDLRVFLLGSALGALYFQRGYFPLHASVVVIDGRAVAFAGDSGSGKSTMAAWMHLQGFPLLCDDVCVVRFADGDRPLAYPGFPRLKLWRDALSQLSVDCGGLQRDLLRAEKFHLPLAGGFWTDPIALSDIFFLEFTPDGTGARHEAIHPAHGVPLLRDNTYRFQYISGLGLAGSHFTDCARVARSARLHHLQRPRRLSASALADCQNAIIDALQ